MHRTRLFTVVLLLSMTRLHAVDPGPLPHAGEFTAKLGWTVKEATVGLGPPKNIFVHRGEVPEEDNIVFFYPDYSYIFWFNDRVWQVRVDERWAGDVDGVRMGMPREAVEELWGPPINDLDVEPTWPLPDQGYPVRVRLYFVDDRLVDLYVYRSDW